MVRGVNVTRRSKTRKKEKGFSNTTHLFTRMQVEAYHNSRRHDGLGRPTHLTPDNNELIKKDDKIQGFNALQAHHYDISRVSPPDSDRDITIVGSIDTEDSAALQEMQFWKTYLKDSRPAEFLLDMPRPAISSGKAEVESFSIDGGLWEQLQQFCQQEQTSLFSVLLAAFRVTQFRMSGISDAVIAGTESTNTKHLGITDYFRIKIDDKESFHQVLSQIYAINDETVDYKRPKLEQVACSLPHAGRNSSATPLSRSLLSLHSELEIHQDGTKYAQPEILPLPDEMMFDMEMHIYPRNASLEFKVVFATDLFKPATIKSLLSIFHQVIDQGIHCPNTPVETLNLMTKDDYDILRRLNLLSPRATAYPRDSTVVDVFRQQVKASPDLTAVKDTIN